MRMASNNIDTISTLVVPNAHSLVIRGGEYPRQLMMEVGGSNIIDMAFKYKQTPLLLIVPYTDIATI